MIASVSGGSTFMTQIDLLYDLLQLQCKTHSVLLRLAAQGPTSRFFWQLRKAATGVASASNRATTGGWPLPKTIYTRNTVSSPQLRKIARRGS